MTTVSASPTVAPLDDAAYRSRIRAWSLYDWANSAFATTILAAVLPVYYSQVAGATLPSEAVATAYWSVGLSISLLVSAILSPILGTISDIVRGKKRFLAIFTAVGVIATGLLVLVDTGDWLLASAIFIVGRIAFIAAITFYDSLLPHVAKPEDRDSVSARGYAMGYLGGGILLAINAGMVVALPGTIGPRLAFLSVALWWAVFAIPLFRRVPEPASATARLGPGASVVGASLARLGSTLRDIRHYRELFKYLVAFLIYNDAIGTIIGMAAIYGAELGFGTVELILALLLVQFAGIPFSLIFGRLPSKTEPRRPLFLAFIVFNLIAIPVVGVVAKAALPASVTGTPQPAYAIGDEAQAGGFYPVDSPALDPSASWSMQVVPASVTGEAGDTTYMVADAAEGATVDIPFHGQEIELVYRTGPDGGRWSAQLDDTAVLDDVAERVVIDTYSPTVRYGLRHTFTAETPGDHVLSITAEQSSNPASTGSTLAFAGFRLPAIRQSNLGVILGLIALVQVVAFAFAYTLGKPLFARLAATLDTRRGILLSLLVYCVVAAWGYLLDASMEFWMIAWLVAIVQGGSQALSRSLYSSMSPAMKSGEFFGFYGVMEKFSSVLGPLVFVFAVAAFGSSRPAVLLLIVLFVVGGLLLTRVNISEGRRIAREEDAAYLARSGSLP